MAKLIAVCGAPGSGKTTVAFKLAQEVYLSTSDCSVTFISPDTTVPTIGMLFPNYKPDSLYSLSALLDSTDISSDLLLENLVTVKNMKNFGCLGFKSGDSKDSAFTGQPSEKEGEQKEYSYYCKIQCQHCRQELHLCHPS